MNEKLELSEILEGYSEETKELVLGQKIEQLGLRFRKEESKDESTEYTN